MAHRGNRHLCCAASRKNSRTGSSGVAEAPPTVWDWRSSGVEEVQTVPAPRVKPARTQPASAPVPTPGVGVASAWQVREEMGSPRQWTLFGLSWWTACGEDSV